MTVAEAGGVVTRRPSRRHLSVPLPPPSPPRCRRGSLNPPLRSNPNVDPAVPSAACFLPPPSVPGCPAVGAGCPGFIRSRPPVCSLRGSSRRSLCSAGGPAHLPSREIRGRGRSSQLEFNLQLVQVSFSQHLATPRGMRALADPHAHACNRVVEGSIIDQHYQS